MIQMHHETKKYEWDAVEFEHMEKPVDWYWGLGIVTLTGCILAILSGNYLLVVLLVLGGFMLGYYGNDKPHDAHVELSERGVRINNDFYRYETMRSFWIYLDHKKRERIIFVTGRPIMPERIITLPDTLSPNELRNFLLEYIEEKETKPSAIDILSESFGL
jgi:hypothetical protein